jgi:mono/diheme cytochrome c family protein
MKLAARIAAVAVVILALALAGCKAGAPSNTEKTVMTDIKHAVTIGGKNDVNPQPDTPEIIKEGQEHFGHHCQVCHGMDGQNTGVPFATKMDPPVADLASKDVQDYADGQLKWIIANGIAPSGMPGWKGILSDTEMWNMVRYIRHLPPKGSLGAPPMYEHAAHQHEHAKHGEDEHTHAH